MNKERIKKAQQVTFVGFFVNLFLSGGKILAGILGQSGAMLADGVHSVSDSVADVIVIIFLRLSGKDADEQHPYGHGKYETFATLLIAIALVAVCFIILTDALSKIMQVAKGVVLPQPGMIALYAALASIMAKEILFRYTLRIGKKIDSQAVIANGWHHRSDAFSSIATALGIAGAIFLGEQWRILDPIAGLIVLFFIVRVAYNLAKRSIYELVESALPTEMSDSIIEIITSHPKVITYHTLKTRKIGRTIAIEVRVLINRLHTFEESHHIAKEIESNMMCAFGQQLHAIILTEPYTDDLESVSK